jgi:Tfp pilus assembly protein PilX
MSNTNPKKFQKGVSLYLTIVILSVLTAALLALVGISVSQIKVTYSLGNSVIAFYAADTGIEEILYNIYKGSYSPSLGDCSFAGNLSGAEYRVCVSDTSTSTIRSTGTYKKIKRKIEIAF